MSNSNQSPPNSPTNPTNPNPPTNQTNEPVPVVIVNETINEPGIQITNQQTLVVDQNLTTQTTFNTTDPVNHVPQIFENLLETVEYNYDDNVITESDNLVNEIRNYATQIKCENFHGKGSIDDYTELFAAASKIATDSKHMELDVDVDGFNEFATAADELSQLFTNFTRRLQNINIINDVAFLRAVSNALNKIVNLSNVFGRFKETILITSEIKVPKTASDAKVILADVMGEVNCAMNYINNFVTPDSNLSNGKLSNEDKHIISKAVDTIDNWKNLCDQGVSIALTNSTDMQYLKNTNIELKQKTLALKNVSSKLRLKLSW